MDETEDASEIAPGIPDPKLLRASIDRVEGDLLREVRTYRTRRRRLNLGLAVLGGITLFAGGVAVGGAAIAPSSHTPPGAKAVFTVDCYSAVDGHRTSTVSFTSLSGRQTVAKEPELACVSLASGSSKQFGLAHLNAQGKLCGIAVSSNCGALYSINTFSQRPLIACRVSATYAAVYPLGKATADVVCSRAKLTVWKR